MTCSAGGECGGGQWYQCPAPDQGGRGNWGGDAGMGYEMGGLGHPCPGPGLGGRADGGILVLVLVLARGGGKWLVWGPFLGGTLVSGSMSLRGEYWVTGPRSLQGVSQWLIPGLFWGYPVTGPISLYMGTLVAGPMSLLHSPAWGREYLSPGQGNPSPSSGVPQFQLRGILLWGASPKRTWDQSLDTSRKGPGTSHWVLPYPLVRTGVPHTPDWSTPRTTLGQLTSWVVRLLRFPAELSCFLYIYGWYSFIIHAIFLVLI